MLQVLLIALPLLVWLRQRERGEGSPQADGEPLFPSAGAPERKPTESASARRSLAYDQAIKASILLGGFFAIMWMVCTSYGPRWLTLVLLILACVGVGGGLLLAVVSGVIEGWNKPIP